MRILVVTSEWPSGPTSASGIHVVRQVGSLRARGHYVDTFVFRGAKNPLRYLRAMLRLRGLDLGGYDVVHAHHGQAGLVAVAQRKLPVVVTFHGSDLQGVRNTHGRMTLLGRVLRLVSRWVSRRVDGIVVVSAHLAKHLPGGTYAIVPVGVDTSLFQPLPQQEARARIGVSGEGPLVLFVGNKGRPEKRMWLAERAIEAAAKTVSVKLLVADGVAHDAMPLYMSAADVLLITSCSEGSPSVVKEALACDLPIVSTDVGDIRTWIEGVEGCHVCDGDAADELGRAVAAVLLRRRRSPGRTIAERCSEAVTAERIEAVYRQAIEGSQAPARCAVAPGA
jgi:glycosyltransferase involved in cell wall biosynthesis